MVIRMVSRMVIRMVSRMVILWLYGVLEGPHSSVWTGYDCFDRSGLVFGSLLGAVWTGGISESDRRPTKTSTFFKFSAIADKF
jgi:hypothetical protein